MAGGYKVKIEDGSEIGPMDLASVRSWYAQGLIGRDSPVLKPGAKSWSTVGQIPELKDLGGGARKKKSAAREEETPPARGGPRPSSSLAELPERWRTVVAAVFFFLGAGAAGYCAYAPEKVLPDLDGAPWLQIALAQLAFGLALVPGWEWGRKMVRAAVFVVAIGLFPLTGILVAQGVRGTALLVLLSAWLLASGLFAFLTGASVSWARAILYLLPVVAGAAGAFRFGYAPERAEDRQVREWATPDRRFSDDALGVSVELPPGWLILKKGNPLVAAPPEARLVLAEPRAGAFAYFVSDSPARGLASLDEYLSRFLQSRRKLQPSLRELSRSDASVGRMSGRKASASWEAGGTRYRDVSVVWRDGWVYFALAAWAPEASAARATRPMEALEAGFSTNGVLAARLQQAIDKVTQEIPQLTAPAAELLMGQSEARVLEPDQAFRRSFEALSRAQPGWGGAESGQMTQLFAALYASLSGKDRTRLAAYFDKVRGRQLTTPEEDREASLLMKGAVLHLSGARRLQLQALYEKAVRAAATGS